MEEIGPTNSLNREDYFDRLSHRLPWDRSFTAHERILIVFVALVFVLIFGCILICCIYPQKFYRRRNPSKRKLDIEQRILIGDLPRNDSIVLPPPPNYESIIKADEINVYNKLNQIRSTDIGRASYCSTTSGGDGIQINGNSDNSLSKDRTTLRSHSARSSLSNGGRFRRSSNTKPLPPFVQCNIELTMDKVKNTLIIHLTNLEHVSIHPTFDEQACFLIHIQLLNNVMLKRINDARTKRRSNLQLNSWKKQREKTTNKLSRTSDGILICDEHLEFEFTKDDLTSSSFRFSFICIDRSGIQDVMYEALVPLKLSMITNYQQLIEFQSFPSITLGEILLDFSYFPTAERFSIKIDKLRLFCRTEKDQRIDARLIATLFHNGRRFFQKKLPSVLSDGPITDNNNIYEIKDIITQNIPLNDIQSIYVHFELIARLLHTKEESILSLGSMLIGMKTSYEYEWQKMLDQPRQNHLGWYKFFV